MLKLCTCISETVVVYTVESVPASPSLYLSSSSTSLSECAANATTTSRQTTACCPTASSLVYTVTGCHQKRAPWLVVVMVYMIVAIVCLARRHLIMVHHLTLTQIRQPLLPAVKLHATIIAYHICSCGCSNFNTLLLKPQWNNVRSETYTARFYSTT